MLISIRSILQGLEDQLLGRVILKEKAELESEKTKLVEDVTANKKKTKELEDNLLYRLTSTQVRCFAQPKGISVAKSAKLCKSATEKRNPKKHISLSVAVRD